MADYGVTADVIRNPPELSIIGRIDAGAGRTIRIARPYFGTEGLHGTERNPPSFQQPALITAHADVVGSLLRPSELLRAQEERAAGRMTPTAFKEIEDSAVDWAVRLQEEAGLEVVTDGEMRRLSFQSQMTEAVQGFGSWDLDAFLWGDGDPMMSGMQSPGFMVRLLE